MLFVIHFHRRKVHLLMLSLTSASIATCLMIYIASLVTVPSTNTSASRQKKRVLPLTIQDLDFCLLATLHAGLIDSPKGKLTSKKFEASCFKRKVSPQREIGLTTYREAADIECDGTIEASRSSLHYQHGAFEDRQAANSKMDHRI